MAENQTIKITKELDIKIPVVPNFILSKDGTTKWPVHEFTGEELEAITEAWKQELFKKAGVI